MTESHLPMRFTLPCGTPAVLLLEDDYRLLCRVVIEQAVPMDETDSFQRVILGLRAVTALGKATQ